MESHGISKLFHQMSLKILAIGIYYVSFTFFNNSYISFFSFFHLNGELILK